MVPLGIPVLQVLSLVDQLQGLFAGLLQTLLLLCVPQGSLPLLSCRALNCALLLAILISLFISICN